MRAFDVDWGKMTKEKRLTVCRAEMANEDQNSLSPSRTGFALLTLTLHSTLIAKKKTSKFYRIFRSPFNFSLGK